MLPKKLVIHVSCVHFLIIFFLLWRFFTSFCALRMLFLLGIFSGSPSCGTMRPVFLLSSSGQSLVGVCTFDCSYLLISSNASINVFYFMEDFFLSLDIAILFKLENSWTNCWWDSADAPDKPSMTSALYYLCFPLYDFIVWIQDYILIYLPKFYSKEEQI